MFNRYILFFSCLLLLLGLSGCLSDDEFYDDEFYDDEFYDEEFADEPFEDEEEFFDEEPLEEEEAFFDEEPLEDSEESGDSAVVSAPAAVTSNANDIRIIEWETGNDSYFEGEFTISSGDASFLVYARSEEFNEYIYFVELWGPNGDALYQADLDSNEVAAPPFGNEWVENVGEAALYYPTAPQFDLDTGSYQVIIQTDGPAITTAGVIIRSNVSDNGRYALDLNILPLTTAVDFDNQQIANEFANAIKPPMNDLLAPHRLEINQIQYFEGSNRDINEYADLLLAEEPEDDDGNRLGQLCLRAGEVMGNGRALNLIIVDQILDLNGVDTGTAGISSGLPGTVLTADSSQSCVVVSWYAFENSYVEQAGNIIHEASHLMSLSHTTEADGTFFDVFTDTPECDVNDYDEDGSGDIDEYECGEEGGARNYMFYSGDIEFAPYDMSDDQAWALRRHPLFYPMP